MMSFEKLEHFGYLTNFVADKDVQKLLFLHTF